MKAGLQVVQNGESLTYKSKTVNRSGGGRFTACFRRITGRFVLFHEITLTMLILTLPLNRSFFGGIDLSSRRWRFAEKESFYIVEKKILRVRISQIKTVVIDDLRLFLQPSTPTGLANLSSDSLPQVVWKRRKRNSLTLFAAMGALYFCHHDLLVCEQKL